MAIILHMALVFWMLVPFLYFITNAANTFRVPALRNNGAVLGQFSFVSGMLCVLLMGLFSALSVPLALCGCVLALCSVLLYEAARRTVIDSDFYIGLGGEVPAAVCDKGPYKYVRHPFYSSYIVAFLGVAAAFPSAIVSGVCLINMGLFVYMAIDDERVLIASKLGADYRAYQMRVGMFGPRIKSL